MGYVSRGQDQTKALSELFAELKLARSSYFYHRARLRVSDKFADLRRVLTSLFELNHRCYGYRRMRRLSRGSRSSSQRKSCGA
jgi:hypothetical protein